jgi:hypothetical protein
MEGDPMRQNISILVTAALILLVALPAVAGVCCIERIAASLGVRYDRPAEKTQVGQNVTATVLSASKLAPHGVTARNNDKVVLTLTGKNTFTLVHAASGRTLKFSFDGSGNLTAAH